MISDILTITLTTPQVNDIIINPSGGEYNTPQTVSMLCETTNAIIRYTVDGSNPTNESDAYTGTFEISETTTVKSIAFLNGYRNSETSEETYIII